MALTRTTRGTMGQLARVVAMAVNDDTTAASEDTGRKRVSLQTLPTQSQQRSAAGETGVELLAVPRFGSTGPRRGLWRRNFLGFGVERELDTVGFVPILGANKRGRYGK